jgi:uncharacterized protein
MLTRKGGKGIEININPHGEPLLYSDLVDLVKDINKIKLVERVSIDTNGLLLNKDLLIELKDAGLTHINLSLNSLDSENAIKIAGSKTYSLKKILSIVKDIIHSGIKLNIAPVIMKDINDKNQLKDLVHLAKDSGASLSAQNFLKYRRGRNPVKEKSWEEFYSELEGLEKKFGTKLILKKEDFDIFKSKELPKPFKKGDVVKVKVVAEGRYPSEMICSAKERAITVRTKKDVGKMMTIKITRSKHNIFFGEET